MTESTKRKSCDSEYFDYEGGRIIYCCQKDKGHKGRHKFINAIWWNDKGVRV